MILLTPKALLVSASLILLESSSNPPNGRTSKCISSSAKLLLLLVLRSVGTGAVVLALAATASEVPVYGKFDRLNKYPACRIVGV